jgi:hypothetical protein
MGEILLDFRCQESHHRPVKFPAAAVTITLLSTQKETVIMNDRRDHRLEPGEAPTTITDHEVNLPRVISLNYEVKTRS